MSDAKMICPVCNTQRTDYNSRACKKCGFTQAYDNLFGGENAFAAWKSVADDHRNKYMEDVYIKSREQGSQLLVTSDRVCFYNADKARATIAEFNNGTPYTLDKVKQMSLSGLYHVWINNDGTLGSLGDDESGQRRLGNITDGTYVATAPKCTYVVKSDGTVASCGATVFKDEISKWKHIKAISCSDSDHIIGVKNDGTVVYAIKESSLFSRYARVMNSWKNVQKVVTTDQYAMALCADGRVLYAGPDDKKAQCTNWENIADVAADGQYAVGLTKAGDVLLAGDTSSLIDFGRSEAANWKNIAFISAAKSLIAGLSKNGELMIVGNMIKNDNLYKNFSTAVLWDLQGD